MHDAPVPMSIPVTSEVSLVRIFSTSWTQFR